MVNVSIVDRAVPPLDRRERRPRCRCCSASSAASRSRPATAVGVEFLNRRLRFEEEVERYLELPVLAVIPDLDTAPDIAHA